MLGRGARPIEKDVGSVKLQVSFVFPRRAKESSPVYFVHHGENASPTTNELVSRDLINLEAFGWWRDVVEGDVEGQGLGGEGAENVLS